MTPAKWTKPRTGDATLRVRFRSGVEREYEAAAKRLRWNDTGHDFDIVAVQRVGGVNG